MKRFARSTGVFIFLWVAAPAAHAAGDRLSYQEQTIGLDGARRAARVPVGYRLELLTDKLDGPRLLTFAANGDLFIGSKSGKVYRLAPPYTAPEVLVTLDGYPHSVAFRPGETANGPSLARGPRLDPIGETANGPSLARGPRLDPIGETANGPIITTGRTSEGGKTAPAFSALPPSMAGASRASDSARGLRLDPIGEILIARTNGLYRAPYTPGQKKIPADTVTLLAALPDGGGHNSRTVGVGPDGRVYVSLGIQGNCSDQYLGGAYAFDDRRGGIMVLNTTDGKPHWEAFGSGLRNPVGFAWHPRTGVLYASNNGPDHLGFEQPPEYFSRVDAGSFHGMPWFQYDGKTIRRDECIKRAPPRPLADVVAPVATFPARNAPMAVAFVPRGAMDPALEFDAIVALRGSWGTQPSGGFLGAAATRRPPKLVAVRFQDGQAQRVDDLITGFQLDDGERWARPVGVAIGPDGALYFTSDSGVNGLFRLRPVR